MAERQSTVSEIREGDIVYLKSGSPPLTVFTVRKETAVVTRFDKGTGFVGEELGLCMLTKTKPGMPSVDPAESERLGA